MNEQGHKLGVYIDADTTGRQYRQRIRTGIRRNRTEYEASHREARRQGRYYDFDEDPTTATGFTRTDTDTTVPTDREIVVSNNITTQGQRAAEGLQQTRALRAEAEVGEET